MSALNLPLKTVLIVVAVSLVFPLIIMFVLSPAIDKILIEDSAEEAYRHASHIGEALGLGEDVFEDQVLSDEFELHAHEIGEQYNLYKINVLSKTGEVIFSTDPVDVGYIAYESFFKESVSKGNRYDIYRPKGSLSLEDRPLEADVVEAYLPIMKDDEFIGAIEVYYNISAARKNFSKLKIYFSIVLFFVAIFLLGAIVVILSRLEERKIKHKKVEKELLEEQLKSEAIVSAFGDAVSIQDLDFKVLYQNTVHKSLIGDHVGEYCYRAYEKREYVCEGCPVAMSFKDGGIHTRERSAPTDRGLLHVEITASPLRDASGKIFAGIEIVRDLTERKNLEDQLRHSQKMEAVGTLTGGVAHEFNNILTAIVGYGELLKYGMEKDNPLMQYVDMIKASSDRAIKLTQSLLAYSRKQVMHKASVRIDEVFNNVEKLLSSLVGENIILRVENVNGDLGVMADRAQLEQILLNLATNSLDAMPNGGALTLRSGRVEVGKDFIDSRIRMIPGTYVCMIIEDTGVGMGKETQERIFEPFFTTKGLGKGTGLGLSMVYGIVKKHDGYITVSSEPDRGTTFRIYIPEAESESLQTKPEGPVELIGGTETVLVAEDDNDVLEIVKLTLKNAGYTVITAINGEEVVNKFMENKDKIDLLLFDVAMPKKNGDVAYKEIKKTAPDIKVIFISGYMPEDRSFTEKLGKKFKLIRKPITPGELLREVRETLT
jgi:signal transduction histidine kinase